MKIAVIMSVYRAENPLKFARALDSIFSQVLPPSIDLKVYLGIDGPIPEGLKKIVNDYYDQIAKVFAFPENRGLAAVLNDLIDELDDEEFIFRMDTDDVSLPIRFARQLDYLALHPEVDILGTSIVEVDELKNTRRIVSFDQRGGREAVRLIARGVPVAHPTVCFRRKVFSSVKGYPLVRYNEDIALWFECLRNGLVISNLAEPLYEFSVGADFFKRRGIKKAFSELAIYMRGVWSLNGFSVDLVYPIARFAVRIAPKALQKAAYGSRLRFRDIEEVTIADGQSLS